MPDATNREAAELNLQAIALTGIAAAEHGDAVELAIAAAGVIAALLDIADAIREGRPAPDADIAKDYHTEAIEGIAEAVRDAGITLDAIRNEVADLRCVVAKIGGW